MPETAPAPAPAPAALKKDPGRLAHAFAFVKDFLLGQNSQTASTASSSHQPKKISVICAGFPRTGTKSAALALERLGHRIYDTRSMLENRTYIDRWFQAAQEWKLSQNLTAIDVLLNELEEAGYTATADLPLSLFGPAFAELRPEAKVLFTVRDTDQVWVQSWTSLNTIMSPLICRPWIWLIPDLSFLLDFVRILGNGFEWTRGQYPEHIRRPLPWFEVQDIVPTMDTAEGQEQWIQLHKQYQNELEKAIVPAERLLIFNVKQGWGPLLRFLEISPSDDMGDFPYVNDSGSLQVVRQAMDAIAIVSPLLILGIILLVATILKKCIGFTVRRLRGKKSKKE